MSTRKSCLPPLHLPISLHSLPVLLQDQQLTPSSNFPNPHGPNDARIIIYGYRPHLALAILAIILFALCTALHLQRLYRYRTYYFLPLTLGLLLEIIGYIFRSLSAQKDPYHIIYFVVQYFCIVTAPVFISASVYVCLSKLIAWAEGDGFQKANWLKPKGILWGFITCDVIATIIQVAGAAMIGSAESNGKSPEIPNNILLAGLAFQTFAFTIFLTLLALFRYSLGRSPSLPSAAVRAKDPFFAALGAASLLIYLRTIFRLAETSQGVFGYLSTHEAFFGALEFAPVVLAVGILGWWHPGRWVSDVGRKRGMRQNEMEIEAAETIPVADSKH